MDIWKNKHYTNARNEDLIRVSIRILFAKNAPSLKHCWEDPAPFIRSIFIQTNALVLLRDARANTEICYDDHVDSNPREIINEA